MSREIAEQFTDALHRLEAERDVETIAGLFGEDASLRNSSSTREYSGTQGAREFWQAYRDAFADIGSEFSRRFTDDDGAVLEWTSTGTLPSGSPVRYDGVSLLDVEGDRITRFRAYFDPRPIVSDA